MRIPDLIPEKIRIKLKDVGLWDLNSLNMFRISWKNEAVDFGGGFGNVNYLEIPSELTGTKARIIMLIGKFFPTYFIINPIMQITRYGGSWSTVYTDLIILFVIILLFVSFTAAVAHKTRQQEA